MFLWAYPLSLHRGTAHPGWGPVTVSLASTQTPGSYLDLGCTIRPNKDNRWPRAWSSINTPHYWGVSLAILTF
jgi:hypothetical protein